MELSPIHTSCKGCIFAEKTDNIQSWCKAGVLAKIDKKVYRATSNDSVYFVIDEFFCRHKRNEKWKSELPEGLSELDAIEQENSPRYHVIMIHSGDLEDTIEMIKNVNGQDVRPSHISIINRTGDADRNNKLVSCIKNYLPNVAFSVINKLIEDGDNTFYDDIDAIVSGSGYPLYVEMHPGTRLPDGIISHIANLWLYGGMNFMAITNHEETVKIVMTQIHRIVGGNNFGILLLDRIEQQWKSGIVYLEDIMLSLPSVSSIKPVVE